MIQENIADLKRSVVEYTGHIEMMLTKSAQGLFERNDALLREVIEEDENISNKMELALDETCINVIAKFQPMAKNLRVIIAIIKMNNNLERIGDHCVNIAQNGLFLNSRPPVKPFIDLPKMEDIVVEMLNKTSKSLIDQDSALAKKVLAMDDGVDQYKHDINDELQEFIVKKPATMPSVLHLMTVVNNLERIADLTTNMCEDVIYMETGEVVKHSGKI